MVCYIELQYIHTAATKYVTLENLLFIEFEICEIILYIYYNTYSYFRLRYDLYLYHILNSLKCIFVIYCRCTFYVQYLKIYACMHNNFSKIL